MRSQQPTPTAAIRRLRWVAWGVALAIAVGGAGCRTPQYAKLRSVPRNPLNEQLQLAAWAGPKPSDRSTQVLRRFDAAKELKEDPQVALDRLRETLEREPSAEVLYTIAELSYLVGKKHEKSDEKAALDAYEMAVGHAYLYLFDERFSEFRNPYDPQFRGACDLYNSALESALRISKKSGNLLPGKTHVIESASRRCEVTVVVRGRNWRPEDFERFEFVSDYEVQGLTNQYRTYGLGVPLIAVRKPRDPADPCERYYPQGLSFPVTAFLRVMPDRARQHAVGLDGHQVLLELYDPLESTDIVVAGRRVPLESDLSTPLAYFLNNPLLNQLATYGLLRPDASQALAGLYMLQPYEQGKIPVLMVHGLWSSPLTWVEMFNDLRSQPEIREAYQFWFYFYPTGQPFWTSAAQMRADLRQLHESLDPAGQEPALGQMVLVGHSMGGLVSKMQTVYSGDDFWRIVSDRPFSELKAAPEVRAQMQAMFFFEPDPYVRRVVTIGTPHRGSNFANSTTRWLSHQLISLPQMLTLTREEVVRDNPDLFRDPETLCIRTSIDSLAPESPVLPVLLHAQPGPGVQYHNIIGVLPKEGIVGKFAGGSDGVVSYESAHLEGVASELTVASDHATIHRHPLCVLEVRKILLTHLEQVRGQLPPAGHGPYPVTQVGGVGPLHSPPGLQGLAPAGPTAAQPTPGTMTPVAAPGPALGPLVR